MKKRGTGCWFCQPQVYGSTITTQIHIPDRELHRGRPVCWECYFLLEDFLDWLRSPECRV